MADNYTSSFQPQRVGIVPTDLKKTVSKVSDTNQIIAVYSVQELTDVANDYSRNLSIGDLAILFDTNSDPVKVYAWQPIGRQWLPIPNLSVNGYVLTDGTTMDKGIVTFAAHDESAAYKAVQADDPRLMREWVAQPAEPLSTSVLWIDTSSLDPVLKIHDGTKWVVAAGREIIDDSLASIKTTYSSSKLESLLSGKSNAGHTHQAYDMHIANTSNPHNVLASQISDLNAFISQHADVAAAFAAKHSHPNKTVLDAITDVNSELFYKGKAIGRGDMQKSVYDKDGDGIVDKAGAISNGAVTFTPDDINQILQGAHIHSNKAILDKIQEPFTTALKLKLDGIADGANNYVHPATHSADMIIETDAKKFVTTAEKDLWNDKYSKLQIDSLLNAKINKTLMGIAGGLATLDAGGKVPLSQLPLSFKETKTVATITDRDLLNKYSGLRVFVADASADSAVGSGSAEYVWDGSKWILLYTGTSGSTSVAWSGITGIPAVLNGLSDIGGTLAYNGAPITSGSSKFIVDDWVAGTQYSAKELVIYNGVIFRAIVSHVSSATFDTAKWQALKVTAVDGGTI